MKILSTTQIRALDQYTIQHQPISSIDLMEQASAAFCDWFMEHFSHFIDQQIYIFCGPGNNGGDGLAIGRLLQHRFFHINIIHCNISEKVSDDFAINLERLPLREGLTYQKLEKSDDFSNLLNLSTQKVEGSIVIDAIFGSGLSRPIIGYWAQLIAYINSLDVTRISVDIPSGLFAEAQSGGAIIKADHTLAFQVPKLAFFMPQNFPYVGQWQIRPIGLSQSFIQETRTAYHYVDLASCLSADKFAKPLFKRRGKFDHKGTFGKALLIVGSYGMAGAATLSAKAALRTGLGLLTLHVPKALYTILQIAVPEAMVKVDNNDKNLSELPDTTTYNAIGIGCGLGKAEVTKEALAKVANIKQALVIDADALNIIAASEQGVGHLPKGCIITPHPKEFERLFGKTGNDFERLDVAIQNAQSLGIFILLKGAHTCVACPNGEVYFNSTGNPGMATAGSGDVLTGIITSLLAQGYSAKEAAILGAFLHGLAGDLSAKEVGQEALIASDIIEGISKAYQLIKNEKT